MAWNEKHENEVRYQEPDLQAAYQRFAEINTFYEVQLKRKYKTVDHTQVQYYFDQYLKLRKKYGYNSGSPNQTPVSYHGSDRAILS